MQSARRNKTIPAVKTTVFPTSMANSHKNKILRPIIACWENTIVKTLQFVPTHIPYYISKKCREMAIFWTTTSLLIKLTVKNESVRTVFEDIPRQQPKRQSCRLPIDDLRHTLHRTISTECRAPLPWLYPIVSGHLPTAE